jgi:hypothetical protein
MQSLGCILPVNGMSVEYMRKAHYFTFDLPLQRLSQLGKPITGSYAKGARNAGAEIVCRIQRGYESILNLVATQ